MLVVASSRMLAIRSAFMLYLAVCIDRRCRCTIVLSREPSDVEQGFRDYTESLDASNWQADLSKVSLGFLLALNLTVVGEEAGE